MSAPLVAKMKANARPVKTSIPQRSPLLGHQRSGAIGHALMPQITIGNQAALRLFAQQARSHEQESGPAGREPASGVDWDFTKILLFPHDLTSQPQAQYPLTAPPLPSVRQPKLAIAAVNDPLEREADQVAEAVVNGRAPVRINGQTGGAASVQRSAVYVRAPVGTSGRIKTGALVDWDYVVYENHLRIGNRVFDKTTKQVIGSWPWLTNNPGDITVDPKEAGKPRSNLNRAYEWGAIKDKAASTGHIPLAIFPDAATGAAALKQLYAEPDYRDKTLAGAIEVHLGNPETRVPGVDDPKKYLERVKERARKLGVSDTLLSKTLAELAAGGAMDAVVEGFGAAEGYENVGVTYTCDGRDKTDDPKIPQTVRNLNLFKSLPDQAPDEVLRLLGCKVPSGPAATVQKKSLNPDLTADSGFGQNASVAQALGATSSALPEGLRQRMETRFGHDFSQVRVHTDATAGASARQVGAQAYTVGQHIVFAAGQYTPGTQVGQRLLAHELTHVVQQTVSPGLAPQTGVESGAATDRSFLSRGH